MISVNQHGALLRDVDYIVSLDSHVGRIVDELDGVKISPHQEFTDYRLCDYPALGNSGMAAVWVAHQMGCCPIVICGVDCYSQGTYWHDPEAESSGLHTPPDTQVARWKAQMDRHCPEAVITVVSGPLLDVFERYERGNRYMAKKKASKSQSAATAAEAEAPRKVAEDRVKVEFIRATRADGRGYAEGAQDYVTARTARTLDQMGKVRILGS